MALLNAQGFGVYCPLGSSLTRRSPFSNRSTLDKGALVCPADALRAGGLAFHPAWPFLCSVLLIQLEQQVLQRLNLPLDFFFIESFWRPRLARHRRGCTKLHSQLCRC